jgi:hypothetical protein
MAHSEGSEPSHRAVDCARGQMCAHFLVVAVGGDGPDHIGGVDVLKSSLHSFVIEIADYLSFEEDTNILSVKKHTGSLMLPELSFSTPLLSFLRSLTPDPAPSATTITKCLFILSCS